MINYAKEQIWRFILNEIKNKTFTYERANLEMVKYDLNTSLFNQWLLEMETEGLIKIPNLILAFNQPFRIQSSDDGIEISINGEVIKFKSDCSAEELIKLKVPNIFNKGGGFPFLKTFSVTDYGLQWLKNGDSKL